VPREIALEGRAQLDSQGRRVKLVAVTSPSAMAHDMDMSQQNARFALQ
jgi:hypothetical protein